MVHSQVLVASDKILPDPKWPEQDCLAELVKKVFGK
jgi:hypothetical protein